jgi:hypothetical protein
MNNINANAKEIVYKNYNIYVGKRLSAGVADSLLHRTGLFFGYAIISGCIRKFGIPNGFFNGL